MGYDVSATQTGLVNAMSSNEAKMDLTSKIMAGNVTRSDLFNYNATTQQYTLKTEAKELLGDLGVKNIYGGTQAVADASVANVKSWGNDIDAPKMTLIGMVLGKIEVEQQAIPMAEKKSADVTKAILRDVKS